MQYSNYYSSDEYDYYEDDFDSCSFDSDDSFEEKPRNILFQKEELKEMEKVISSEESEIDPNFDVSLSKLSTNISTKLNLKSKKSPPFVTAEAWAIYDLNSKQFINGKNCNKKREIASLTKIMTAYAILVL